MSGSPIGKREIGKRKVQLSELLKHVADRLKAQISDRFEWFPPSRMISKEDHRQLAKPGSLLREHVQPQVMATTLYIVSHFLINYLAGTVKVFGQPCRIDAATKARCIVVEGSHTVPFGADNNAPVFGVPIRIGDQGVKGDGTGPEIQKRFNRNAIARLNDPLRSLLNKTPSVPCSLLLIIFRIEFDTEPPAFNEAFAPFHLKHVVKKVARLVVPSPQTNALHRP